MSSSRMISLAEAVSWFAWDQRFTAEDFIAVRLKVNAGELSRYRKNLREGKGPVVSTEDLKIYRRAVANDRKIAKRIEEASGHSYESKAGREAANKELDAAFAVIVKAIQDGRDITARGQRDTDNEGGRPIPWKWFDENPEPTVSYEMNVLGHGILIDIDKNELPKLQDGWTDVELNWGEIKRLRGETSAWPQNKRNELAVTDEPSPAPDSKGGTTALPAAPQSDAKIRKATVGRPSHRTEIQAAYKKLVEAGEIDFDAPKTATYEPIRQKVRRVLGNEVAGLGDEAIRLVIAPLFDRDKAAKALCP